MNSDIEERTTATGLMNYGWTYLRAAEYLDASVADGKLDLNFKAPQQFLAAHALELLLKAFLRSEGCQLTELKRLGHSLADSLRKSEKLGLKAMPSECEARHIDLLGADHGGPHFKSRYIQTGPAKEARLGLIFAYARRLMDEIERLIAPDRVKNCGLRTRLEPHRQET